MEIYNADFENYSFKGNLAGWEEKYVLKPLAFADSVNVIEGKYCLKLPVVQNQLLYPPVPITQPHIISLPIGYKAYVPLQLYAKEKSVFPTAGKQAIRDFSKDLKKDSLTVNQMTIACMMQIWATLYHDYPYREADFKDKLNRLLLQTIWKLETADQTALSKIFAYDFMLWINDPRLTCDGKFPTSNTNNTNNRKVINLPVKYPDATCLTETQWVVTNVIDSVTNLQVGDVILQINDINIDSLLQLYRAHNISRSIQKGALAGLSVTYGESEMKVQLLRNGKIVDTVFSTDTRQNQYSWMPKEKKEKHQSIQETLKETKKLFYLNAMDPPKVFNPSIVHNTEKILNQLDATDSLITELNKYEALILDVRGRPISSILSFFNECMGLDLNRNSDVIKTAFSPIAQFQLDTLSYTFLDKRENAITIPVYVLIDYNTESAPERNLLSLKESERATFIGSNTAGAAGIINRIKISDNITLTYTSGQVVGLDNNPMSYQGTGIAPDIYVYPTPQGIAEGRDEVLEKAIEMAVKNMQKKK